jgi:SsrA-binding protein
MAKLQKNIRIKNRKASFEYELIERFVAGIQLVGTEIKSIRGGKANLTDAYGQFINGELYIKNLHITEYELGTCNNHIAKRDRKLLLNKKELQKLDKKVRESGFTIVSTVLFINERGLAKLEIALARGKKNYDKRESLKSKDADRDMDRMRKF